MESQVIRERESGPVSVKNASGVSAREEYKECFWRMQGVGFLEMECVDCRGREGGSGRVQ